MEQSNKLQDIVFTMDSYHFNGSKVGRRFSYSKFGTTLFRGLYRLCLPVEASAAGYEFISI
ncbi:hypothetical protein NXV27_09095 [Bacteroides fragilis]|nr:hypothetical protein [Bacteroides fragilis]